MSKNDCYVVLNLSGNRVVSDVTSDFFSKLIHYASLNTVGAFGQFDTLSEAKKFRREHGGVILKAVKGL